MGGARGCSTRMAEASFREEQIAHMEYFHRHQDKHKTVIESGESDSDDDDHLPLLPGEAVETDTDLSFYIVQIFNCLFVFGIFDLIRFRIFVLALIAEAQLAYDFC